MPGSGIVKTGAKTPSKTPEEIHNELDDDTKYEPAEVEENDTSFEAMCKTIEKPSWHILYPPKVMITPEAMDDINLFIEIGAVEVGWLGLVQRYGHDFLVHKVFIPEQVVSSTETDISTRGISYVVSQLREEHKNDNKKFQESLQQLRYWGHSHVRMACNPSKQDDAQMEEFCENGVDFMIRSIHNKKGEVRFDIHDYQSGIRTEHAPWAILRKHGSAERKNMWLDLYKQHVKKKKAYTYSNRSANHFGGNTVHYPSYSKVDNVNTPKNSKETESSILPYSQTLLTIEECQAVLFNLLQKADDELTVNSNADRLYYGYEYVDADKFMIPKNMECMEMYSRVELFLALVYYFYLPGDAHQLRLDLPFKGQMHMNMNLADIFARAHKEGHAPKCLKRWKEEMDSWMCDYKA